MGTLALTDAGWACVEQPSYSPCGVQAFAMLKHEPQGQKFDFDSQVTQATATVLHKTSKKTHCSAKQPFIPQRPFENFWTLHGLQTGYI